MNGPRVSGSRTALLPVLLIVAAVASGCSVNPATGRSQLLLLSSSEVNAMGESAMPELIAEYGGEVPSQALHDYVASVGRDLAYKTEAENPRLDWEFVILDSDIVNAFALPGGKVFLSRALMEDMINEAQLAGVLGHEIGHVTARHVDERITQALGADLTVQVIGVMTSSELAQASAAMFSQGYQLKFGRDQELEADRLGVKYMTRAGYDPLALMQVMHILKAAVSSGSPPEFLSTHPDPDRRIAQIREMLEGPYKHTQNNPEYRMFEQRFQREALPRLAGSGGAPATTTAAWCAVCAAGASH